MSVVRRRLFILIILGLLAVGCVGYDQLLKDIPLVEFESFTYSRGGNITSASITATNGKIEKGVLTVEDVHIIANYGPFLNFDVQLRGYRRKIK